MEPSPLPERVRGELTIRALRRFIAREGACGPFQAEMLRKVVLMEHLNGGGTLASLGRVGSWEPARRHDASAIRPD